MAVSTKKITDLASLDQEVRRLKGYAKGLEKKLDNSFDHLQDNFFTMAWNSFLYKSGAREWTSGIAKMVFKNETAQDIFTRVVSFVAERASNGIDWLLQLLSRKKDPS